VVAHGFGVLSHHDLWGNPSRQRVAISCAMPGARGMAALQAARVLGADLRLAMALPCRIPNNREDSPIKSTHFSGLDLPISHWWDAKQSIRRQQFSVMDGCLILRKPMLKLTNSCV